MPRWRYIARRAWNSKPLRHCRMLFSPPVKPAGCRGAACRAGARRSGALLCRLCTAGSKPAVDRGNRLEAGWGGRDSLDVRAVRPRHAPDGSGGARLVWCVPGTLADAGTRIDAASAAAAQPASSRFYLSDTDFNRWFRCRGRWVAGGALPSWGSAIPEWRSLTICLQWSSGPCRRVEFLLQWQGASPFWLT